MADKNFYHDRIQMVDLLKRYGISDQNVLNAMLKVKRHLFVSDDMRKYAYMDSSLKIDCGQTISQPYIVAFMTEAAALNKKSKVLEIGTGSGYQTAILAEICHEVCTVEIVGELSHSASTLLGQLGYSNIEFKISDGHEGWEEKGKFDAIIITAAAKELPKKLLEQLAVGGKMIVPIDEITAANQILMKITKTSEHNEYTCEELLDVMFVPMIKT